MDTRGKNTCDQGYRNRYNLIDIPSGCNFCEIKKGLWFLHNLKDIFINSLNPFKNLNCCLEQQNSSCCLIRDLFLKCIKVINKIIPVSIALPVTLHQEQKINELDPDCQCRLVLPKGLKLFPRGHIFS